MAAHTFRLISTGFNNAYYNMGLDEALLEGFSRPLSPPPERGPLPLLRFYGWNPPAVSVGYFQRIEEEVDTARAKQLGFDLVRRVSGGGAVLHKSELTYSIVMGIDHPLAGKNVGESYRILSAGLAAGLQKFGVTGLFSGINDMLAGGKKISGSAQTRRGKVLLQHGTVLLDSDTETMFQALKVSQEKLRAKGMEDAKDQITSLKDITGREISFEEAEAAFSLGFAEALGLEYKREPPRPEEDRRARELARDKFASPRWLFKKEGAL